MPTVADLGILIRADDQASAALARVRGNLDQTQAATLAVGAALTTVGVGMVASLASAGKAAADFEKAMSQVKAVLSPAEIQASGAALSQLALSLGQSGLGFSATQAAAGLEAMSKAGLSVADQMSAAKDVLALAAAGGIRVGEAAEFAANTLSVFNLKGTDMERVANLMAGAANATTADIGDLRLSMQQFGAVANLTGQTVDSATTAIAAMAAAGIRGSDAGTSLKTMFLNLQPSTERARQEMERLGLVINGVNAFINQETGAFKQAGEIAAILSERTAHLTQAQKAASLEIIFGTDAIRAATVMANAGAEGWARLTGEIGKVSAVDVARERLNNLHGDLQKLSAAAETAAIQFGGNLAPSLRPVAQAATDVVNTLAGLPPNMQATAAAVSVLVAGATTLAGVMLTSQAALALTGTTLGALAAAAAPVVVPIAAITAAVGVLAAAWINDWGGIQGHTATAAAAIGTELDGINQRLASTGEAIDRVLQGLAQMQAERTVAPDVADPAASFAGGDPTRSGEDWASAFVTAAVQTLNTPRADLEPGFVGGGEQAGAVWAGAFVQSATDWIKRQENQPGFFGPIAPTTMALNAATAADALATNFESELLRRRPRMQAAGEDMGEAVAEGVELARPHVINATERIVTEAGAHLAAASGNIGKAIAEAIGQATAEGATTTRMQQLTAEILTQANAAKALAGEYGRMSVEQQAVIRVIEAQTNAQTALRAAVDLGIITEDQYAQALGTGRVERERVAAATREVATATQALADVEVESATILRQMDAEARRAQENRLASLVLAGDISRAEADKELQAWERTYKGIADAAATATEAQRGFAGASMSGGSLGESVGESAAEGAARGLQQATPAVAAAAGKMAAAASAGLSAAFGLSGFQSGGTQAQWARWTASLEATNQAGHPFVPAPGGGNQTPGFGTGSPTGPAAGFGARFIEPLGARTVLGGASQAAALQEQIILLQGYIAQTKAAANVGAIEGRKANEIIAGYTARIEEAQEQLQIAQAEAAAFALTSQRAFTTASAGAFGVQQAVRAMSVEMAVSTQAAVQASKAWGAALQSGGWIVGGMQIGGTSSRTASGGATGGSTVLGIPFNPWGIAGLADGGIVTRPTLAMVGERGPEAVVPLGSMAPTIVINYQPTVSTASPAEVDTLARLLSRAQQKLTPIVGRGG